MADLFERDPYLRLNLPRKSSADEVDAAFAAKYKAARHRPDAEAVQQALNQALEILRDPEARAEAEVAGWWLPLADDAAVPDLDALLDLLLPCRPDESFDPDAVVPGPTPGTVARQVADTLPRPAPPDVKELLRQLAARLAIEAYDPWSDADE